jgi:uncharacterized protein (DUF58 family)
LGSQEKYLRPDVIRQVQRLDLRARFIVEGFLSGLHRSPFQGFSSEFSEHRKYEPGDDIQYIDWNVFARTDRYYVKKFEAETNLTGYLVMDLSASMNYTFQEDLTKFEYGICLAAALAHLMIKQSDSVGLVTFDEKLRLSMPPSSRRGQLGKILATLSRLQPTGPTNVAGSLHQVASLVPHKSLVLLFSDLLAEPEPIIDALHRLRHRGNDVIVFHILDAAEVGFPFRGMTDFRDNESDQRVVVDADGVRADYLAALTEFRDHLATESAEAGIDFVPVDTGMPFDRALVEYLQKRTRRG